MRGGRMRRDEVDGMDEAWAALDAALEARARAKGPLRLWWRDDDAVRWTPALARLVALAGSVRAPLALAAIPAGLDPALAATLEGAGGEVAVLQHGFAHRNAALRGERAVELGGGRDTRDLLGDLGAGRETLAAAFGPRFLPVMVPPWNRIEARIAEALPGLGFRGLSAFGGEGEQRVPGLRVANAHLDVLRWKGGAHFAGEAKLIAETLLWLERRAGDGAAPFGLLTHHLDHDEATWAFLERFLRCLLRHARPIGADEVFGLVAPRG
ncbi:polysaccharide deacetylase family protein [Aureimonas sp. AU4]|uniref:polysaccharide deacetylase family protein n=1 Tax=Aureimonas sp. AU4 TaxID=1638163 RepID=UPI00178C9D73|nr:polysaccharide deacetylase family protein [Aureimonas sp. AU4]